MKSPISKLLVPALFLGTALASLLFTATPSDAGPRRRVVVVKPRPAVSIRIATPRAEHRVWVAGHWKWVGPRRAVWVPGHWR